MVTSYLLVGVAVIVAAVLLSSTLLVEPIDKSLPKLEEKIEKVFKQVEKTVTPVPDRYIADYSQQVLERQLAIEQQFKEQQEALEKQQAYNCTRHTGLDYC